MNRNALIIGGTRGIGLALVEALLADPAYRHVVTAGRSVDGHPELDRLAARHGDRCERLPLDLADEASIAAAAATLQARRPALHLLITTAGLLHGDGLNPERRLAEIRPDHLLASYAVNAVGPILIAKHFHGLLAHGERAVLATLSARVGSIGDNRLGGWYAYRAAKAAQNQLMHTAAIELARRARELIVVSLHPGTVETGLSAPFRGNVAAEKLFTPAYAAERLLSVIAGLGRESSGRFYAWDGSEIPW
ncbi:MAG: SDR family NAD(P)-dependent oxidoreductase [Gammaproteobacteria bacterium]|nr:SDR family NAD(P)-dependent oxidoreductase [Gammaproteobacteria bacterium]